MFGRLTLRELDTTAGTAETVLLAFLHAGISRQEAVVPKRLEEVLIHPDQSASQAHANSAGLTHRTATGDANKNIHRLRLADAIQGLLDLASLFVGREVFVKWATIDDDLSLARANSDSCDAGLATSGAQSVSVDPISLLNDHAENQFP
jgi:hypothetical protein